jgi:hypothetical protein
MLKSWASAAAMNQKAAKTTGAMTIFFISLASDAL